LCSRNTFCVTHLFCRCKLSRLIVLLKSLLVCSHSVHH
jgi:hypothetical protein